MRQGALPLAPSIFIRNTRVDAMKLIHSERERYKIIIKKRMRRLQPHKNINKKTEKQEYISAPERFFLGDNESRKLMIDFLENIKRESKNNKTIRISFAKTKDLHICGTLFFISTINEILSHGKCTTLCKRPADNTAEQLFQHVGILDLIGLESRLTISAENVKDWHLFEGVAVTASQLTPLFEEYNDLLKDERSSGLYGAITEAITNTIQHAYPGHDQNSSKKWWVFSQRKKSLLSIAIYDSGIGIPKSLKTKIRELLRMSDSKIIENAVRSNETSTKLTYRGKGLPEMLTFAQRSDVGGFVIHSSKGFFGYNSTQGRIRGDKFRDSIPGTLIIWEFNLDLEFT